MFGNEPKLQIISRRFQSRVDKLQMDTGALSSVPRSSSSSEQAIAQPEKNDVGTQVVHSLSGQDTDDEEQARDSKGVTLTQALKNIREMRLEPQYVHKAHNFMIIILENPDVLTRNDKVELVVNGLFEPNTNINLLFSSIVWRDQNLKQHVINKFLCALRQIPIKLRVLSGKSLQRVYSNMPYHVRVSNRAPRPKKHQREFDYDVIGESDIETEYEFAQLRHITPIAETPTRNGMKP